MFELIGTSILACVVSCDVYLCFCCLVWLDIMLVPTFLLLVFMWNCLGVFWCILMIMRVGLGKGGSYWFCCYRINVLINLMFVCWKKLWQVVEFWWFCEYTCYLDQCTNEEKKQLRPCCLAHKNFNFALSVSCDVYLFFVSVVWLEIVLLTTFLVLVFMRNCWRVCRSIRMITRVCLGKGGSSYQFCCYRISMLIKFHVCLLKRGVRSSGVLMFLWCPRANRIRVLMRRRSNWDLELYYCALFLLEKIEESRGNEIFSRYPCKICICVL